MERKRKELKPENSSDFYNLREIYFKRSAFLPIPWSISSTHISYSPKRDELHFSLGEVFTEDVIFH